MSPDAATRFVLGAVLASWPGLASAQPDAGAMPATTPSTVVELEPLPVAHEPRVTITLGPQELILGQILTVRIEASVPKGDDVTIAQQELGAFEVVERRRTVQPLADGRQTFVFELTLQTFDPGVAELAPIRLRVVTADGIVGNSLTKPQPIKIVSLLANEPDAQPRPATEPVTVMQDDYMLLWIAGIIVAVLLIAGLTLLIQRRLRRRPQPEPPAPPPRPPWEIAAEKLALLRRRKQQMLDDGQGMQFVDEVSNTVREYLGGCFGFEGMDTTTEEMLTQLRQHRANPGLQGEVGAYLRRCDLVKFANVDPDHDEADLIFAKAQDIVQFSMPLGTDGRDLNGPSDARNAADSDDATRAASTDSDAQREPSEQPPKADPGEHTP